ncbi:adhesion G protein-coupled receptor L2-like isoform X1 [Ptychodera flava]|uniref:adhesion G protein-coupled receptor L2-like isoform X1 n=1 Tax=Ptychodera flava TaxID=63121 RepID=UPI00396AADBC
MRSHGNSMHWQDLLCLSLLLELLQAGLCPVTASHYHTPCHPGYHKFPKCIDTPGAYLCECGPGFEWNSHMCVAKAADSRLEFLDVKPVGYTLLLGKTFPQLSAFTISMWVKAAKIDRDRVYLSYSTNDQKPQIMVERGKNTKIYVAGQMVLAPGPTKAAVNTWQHLAFTWSNRRGDWAWYVDGQRVVRSDKLATNITLPIAGEFVLGQAPRSRETLQFEEDRMFMGDLSHVNVWTEAKNKTQIQKLSEDCTFMQCGDAVQWVDFRSGTRGSMKLRWPSGIFATGCNTNPEKACDSYCSHTIGPQCNQDIAGNIEWPRTPAGHTKSLLCPGLNVEDEENVLERWANRTCQNTGGLHGQWDVPIINQCASREQLELSVEIREALEKPNINGSLIIYLTRKLDNYTKTFLRKTNPIDLAIDIACLDMLVELQSKSLHDIAWSEDMLKFAQTHLAYPTFTLTTEFSRIVVDIVSAVMDSKNEIAWSETKPRGQEAVQLLKVIRKFTDVLATSLTLHRRRGEISYEEASISALTHNFVLDVITIKLSNYRGIKFPTRHEDLLLLDHFSLPRELFNEVHLTPDLEYVVISNAKYNSLGRLLPNHPEPIRVVHFRDKAKEHAHKEDNINTALLATRIHLSESEEIFQNLTTPILIDLSYDKPFNVSNPECVTLYISNTSDDWKWTKEGCEILSYSQDGARCHCRHPGIFALTTDMYDIDWNCCNERIFEVTIPAYIGYIINVAFCIASLILFSHFKCLSDTVNVHRNLAMSIILAQTSYVIGVARREDEGLCKGFAIVLHYFFTSEFCWLCNEAFNLYVEVANSIHAETQQQRPMLRYYIIGWVFPGALVGALVGANWENYFAEDICWISMDQIWLFVGPVAGVWAITCFVLTFTGKDIVESSYSKDKQANKVVSNHCKGCWVQITLIVISWAFAFVSVKMVGLILQVLYAFFVILQGSFFFVFFCVLNGEVATALRERRARLGLAVSSPSFSTKYSVYRRAPTSPTSKKDRTESTDHGTHTSGSLASASIASASVGAGVGSAGVGAGVGSAGVGAGGLSSSTNHFEMRNRKTDHATVEFSEELVTTV